MMLELIEIIINFYYRTKSLITKTPFKRHILQYEDGVFYIIELIQPISPDEMTNILEEAGWKMVAIIPSSKPLTPEENEYQKGYEEKKRKENK